MGFLFHYTTGMTVCKALTPLPMRKKRLFFMKSIGLRLVPPTLRIFFVIVQIYGFTLDFLYAILKKMPGGT